MKMNFQYELCCGKLYFKEAMLFNERKIKGNKSTHPTHTVYCSTGGKYKLNFVL